MSQLFIGELIGLLVGCTLIIFIISNVLDLTLFKNQSQIQKKGPSLLVAVVIVNGIWLFMTGTLSLQILIISLCASTILFVVFIFRQPKQILSAKIVTEEITNLLVKPENTTTPPYYLFTIGFLVLVVLSVSYITVDTNKEVLTAESPDTAMVTNPEYLKNPSKYIVDYSDVVQTVLPVEKPLWVESIGELKSPRMMFLKVSYERVVEGTNIIELTDLLIPGIAGLYCNEELLRAYLQQNVVGKYLFLTAETSDFSESTWYTPHMYAQFNAPSNQYELYGDLSEQMISDGFGRVPVGTSEHLYSNYSSSYNDSRKRYNPEEKITDPVSFNTNASLWWQQLVEKEQISKLKKVGGWAYCK